MGPGLTITSLLAAPTNRGEDSARTLAEQTPEDCLERMDMFDYFECVVDTLRWARSASSSEATAPSERDASRRALRVVERHVGFWDTNWERMRDWPAMTEPLYDMLSRLRHILSNVRRSISEDVGRLN